MRTINSLSRTDPKVLALVLAGGNGTRLHGLTRHRAKPALPFGGHHRIVDYTLSNCVNSGVSTIAVLTQYKAQSLIRHLQRNWLSGRASHAESIEIWPAQQRNGTSWYAGTADAVHQNRDLIEEINPDNVLILAGDHVYAMDYTSLAAAHARTGADVTISCVEVPVAQSREFGIVEVDDSLRLTGFLEKPTHLASRLGPTSNVLASMGIYLFNTDYLLDCLNADARNGDSRHDFGYDILPWLIGDARVYASLFRARDNTPGYWRDVGTIDSYWLAHRELLQARFDAPRNGSWPLHGSPRVSTPARLTPAAAVKGSTLGAGCLVAGSVYGSVVSTGCLVAEGSIVSDSVLLPGASVGRNCRLKRVIVDSRCHVPDGIELDAEQAGVAETFHASPAGVVLVTEDQLVCVPHVERKTALA